MENSFTFIPMKKLVATKGFYDHPPPPPGAFGNAWEKYYTDNFVFPNY